MENIEPVFDDMLTAIDHNNACQGFVEDNSIALKVYPEVRTRIINAVHRGVLSILRSTRFHTNDVAELQTFDGKYRIVWRDDA